MTVNIENLPNAQVLVVLNGVPVLPESISFENYEQIVVADGAWDKVNNQTWADQITAVMGDGDSILARPEGFVTLTDQNFTDFEKILRHLATTDIQQADVVCGSGGEMDHFLGNLSVAAKYADEISLRFWDEHQYYCYVTENCQLNAVLDKTISLYPFPRMTVKSHGLRYEMQHLALDLCQQQSLRNRAIVDTVRLEITGAGWLFVSL